MAVMKIRAFRFFARDLYEDDVSLPSDLSPSGRRVFWEPFQVDDSTPGVLVIWAALRDYRQTPPEGS